MKIIFLINANKYSGGGHFYRCLKLISRLFEEQHEVSVLEANIEKFYIDKLLSLGIKTVNQVNKSDYIFCDNYALNLDDYKNLSRMCQYLVVMDDLCNRQIYADYLWDPNPLRSRRDYEDYINYSAELLLGGKYAFFDDSTKNYYYSNKKTSQRSLHLYFGQGKANTLTQAYEYLRKFPYAIDTVSGDDQNIQPCKNDRKDDRHFGFVSPFSASLARAKLCLGSPGNALWERMLFGVPTLIKITNENQRKICEMLVAKDFAFLAPENIGHETSRDIDYLLKVFEDEEKLNFISKKISKCFDIAGIDNFLSEIGLIFEGKVTINI